MQDFPLAVTAWTTVILGALYIWLTAKVIFARRRDGIVMGDNDDRIVAKKIRGHANAAEQIPLGIILIGFNEALNSSATAVTIAALLIVGRFAHGIYFAQHGTHHSFRVYGMLLTLTAQILGVIGVALGLII